jgi:hypothetical protein
MSADTSSRFRRPGARAASAPTRRTHGYPCHCGEAAGWIDIDPTNDCLVDDEHVTLGWGRDFGDVTPMRGVILGAASRRSKCG